MTTPKKPLIFLDVDGVLNTTHQIEAVDYNAWVSRKTSPGRDALVTRQVRWAQLSPDHFDRLARLVEETNAEVVLSTTWRESRPEKDILLEALAGYGIVPVGSTPIEGDRKMSRALRPRGVEIAAWLHQNDITDRPFLVLDDMCKVAMLGRYYQALMPIWDRFIRTSDTQGLTERDVKECHLMLEEQETWAPYEDWGDLPREWLETRCAGVDE